MTRAPKSADQQEEFVTFSQLKTDYGLPPSWIERLGEPDKLKKNPIYKSAAPMKLFLRNRIDAFIKENDEAYRAMQVKRAKRVEAGLAAADRRRQTTLAWASAVELTFHPLPANLSKAATEHFDSRNRYTADWEPAGPVNERGVIAMLRHAYSNYHTLLDELYGEVGRWEAYKIIRDRINQKACDLAGIEFRQASDWAKGEDRWLSGRWKEAVDNE